MHNKKNSKPEKTPEQEALERRVDAMMDTKKPDETPDENLAPPTAEKPVPEAPETGKDTKTAPQLSTKLRKQIGVADVPTAPLSIDKLDELTESIAGPDTATEPVGPEAPKTPEPADPAEPAPQDDGTEQSTDLDDNRIEKAVDDIVAHEGDVMLAVEDATAAERNRKAGESSGQKSESHPFAAFMWTLVIIIVIVAILALVLLVTGGNMPNLPKL